MTLKTILFILVLLLTNTALTQDCPIFPQPTNFSKSEGDFFMKDMLSISKKDLPEFMLDDLKWYVTHDLGVNAIFTYDGGDLLFQRMMNVPADFYSIRVKDKITINYSSEASLFYAMQSLKQLMVKEEGMISIPHCSISDQPKFQWRGMHLDVSRHFFKVDEVKQYLDWMARYKFNRFHWHLTDDQGWRIEIKKYPKLTEIGSVRAKTLVGHAGSSKEYDKTAVSGFYTQAEIKEIIRYAKTKFIEVVPEIEMPGHARAALAAYPEYSCTGEKLPVAETWGVFEHVFCSKKETIDFLQDILSEVIELFPGEYIHIGGDEAPKTNWKTCPACQNQIKINGLKDEAELQSYFIQQMGTFLTKNGKKLIGWDEILEGGLAANATVMSWRGTQGGIEAAEQNHTVVMTPGSHCYFDHYQSDRGTEPLAIGGYTPLEKVYGFNPIPDELSGDKRGLILGAQANVWTEYMKDFDQVQYMILPRMVALSEVLWGTNNDYQDFLSRLKNFEFPYYDKMETPYSRAAFYVQSDISTSEEGIIIEFTQDDGSQNLQIIGDNKKSIIPSGKNKLKVNRTPGKYKVKIQAVSGMGSNADTVTLIILQHSTLGAEWDLLTKPSPYYNGDGAFTLTDGIIGRRPWNGKEWLGFDTSNIKLKFAFKKKRKVSSINVGFLQAETSWVYLPNQIVVRYSKNGKRSKEATVSVDSESTKLKLNKKVQYIELEILGNLTIPEGKNGAGHAPWIFMDEIWFDFTYKSRFSIFKRN
ncbi:beta-N-acetylhexosaminidase [Crocinitomicaceae bacterium]|nr:beta-N-acetylhexosaminidase [Crocinitomicaceae bacterium]